MFSVPSFADLNVWMSAPGVVLAVGACLLLLIDVVLIPRDRKIVTAFLALGTIIFSFVVNLFTFNETGTAFLGMFAADGFTSIANVIILVSGFISILMSVDYLKRTGIERGEFYSLILFSLSGIMFMAGANDLVTIFVSLELLSIPLYILAAFRVPDVRSEESGMKYFILGAFASAFLVYGSALVFGATGTTTLPDIFASVEQIVAAGGSAAFLLLLGTGLILVGLGFKVAVVPFHMWTPDVYEGAPTPVTAFMSVGAKIGGFAALLRIVVVALPTFVLTSGETIAAWQQTFWLVAAATILLGNFVAIAQTNIKRMLAYSSIAHAGYIMMAVAAAGTSGLGVDSIQAALLYLFAYMFTNLGAFAVALAVEKDDGSGTNLDDFVGLAKSRPAMAFMMAVFMLSLTGIPLTAGFIGKWYVFRVALEANLLPLAIIGVLTSVVSAFYYVRIIVNMYLKDGEGDQAAGATEYVNWAIYVAFAGTVVMGILPFLATNLTDSLTVAAAVIK
ncbi:MAG: NADH-quinone oxidoreductase subunit N [Chloroflexi bacterium]|nr:NADH-quinone oxidoreductase subunit N [Chloroflexota bacterium]MCC6894722.1 NADH-quinone oxidoreductase subunit N [Anaerolineae bacterium]